MKFKYLAKKGPTEKIEGTLDVASEEEATQILIKQGLSPLQIEEVIDINENEATNEKFVIKKLKQQQLLEFTRNLYNLLRAHVGMLKALLIIEQQTENLLTKKLVIKIYQRVKEGESFSDVLKQFSSVFSPFYISLIKVGEVSGKLEFALEKICEYLEQRQEMKRKIVSSLAYPLMMIIVGAGTTIVLFTFVIPRLSGLFLDLGQELPLITQALINVSSWFSNIVFWWIVCFCTAVFFIYQRFSSRKVSFVKFLKKMPFVKNILLLEEVTTFSYTLSLLLRSGVSLLDALRVSQSTLQDEKMAQEVNKVREEITRGSSLAESTRYFKSFPKIFSSMVSIGEEAGMLSDTIDAVTQVLTKELEGRMKVLSSLIEPVIIFLVGIVLGAIIIALLLPILQMGALDV